MALKSSTGAIYMLFNACLPDDKKVKKRLFLEEIIESNEYKKLSKDKRAVSLMKTVYSFSSLQKQDEKTLGCIKEALPYAEKAIDAICLIKRHGDAETIDMNDVPDFTSKQSLQRVISNSNRLSVVETLTNIKDTDLFGIYKADTIRNLDDLYKTITIKELEQLEDKIDKTFKGQRYWVNPQKIRALQKKYNEQKEMLEEERKKLVNEKTKRYGTKAIVTGGFLASSVAVLSAVGATSLPALLIGAVACAIYWIKG